MVTRHVGRIIPVLLFVAAFLAVPGAAYAQTTTLIVPFERLGAPELDDLGNPVPGTGGMANPCTGELVDVVGSSTITTSQKLANNGDIVTSVTVLTKGTGTGQVSLVLYPFRESQSFSVRRPSAGGPAIDSTFNDKLAMRGPGAVDNWVVRATMRLRIDAAGNVLIDTVKLNEGICKG